MIVKKICLIIAFCLLISIIYPIITTMVYAEVDEYEWTYEFEEFDDDCLVLSPQKQEMYMLDSLTASYSSGITTYDNYMEIYYDNLTENLGNNYKGSCGYVAVGMLLSYYDTYINDSIIPDSYDIEGEGISNNLIAWRDSPGVLKDIIDNGYSLTASDYYNIIKNQSGYSFHAKLITIGHGWGYYNYFSDNPAGTTFGMIMAVLESYLKLYRGYNNTEYSLDYAYELIASEDNSVRDFVIENIQSGKPVLLGVQGIKANNEKEGHVVIAYDYDEITDQIYCHFGWGADKTHITPESEGLTLYKAALALDFYLPYSHAYNYIENKGQSNEKSYCSCDFFCHPEHICRHYTEYDNNYHKYMCGCSEELFEHNLSCSYFDDFNHIKSCADCGYTQTETHDYTHGYEYIGAYEHREYCECGAFVEGDHVYQIAIEGELKLDVCVFCKVSRNHEHDYTYTSCGDGKTHMKECDCGISQTQQCFGTTMPGQLTRCISCGQRLNGGLITPLSVEDILFPSNKEDNESLEK